MPPLWQQVPERFCRPVESVVEKFAHRPWMVDFRPQCVSISGVVNCAQGTVMSVGIDAKLPVKAVSPPAGKTIQRETPARSTPQENRHRSARPPRNAAPKNIQWEKGLFVDLYA